MIKRWWQNAKLYSLSNNDGGFADCSWWFLSQDIFVYLQYACVHIGVNSEDGIKVIPEKTYHKWNWTACLQLVLESLRMNSSDPGCKGSVFRKRQSQLKNKSLGTQYLHKVGTGRSVVTRGELESGNWNGRILWDESDRLYFQECFRRTELAIPLHWIAATSRE